MDLSPIATRLLQEHATKPQRQGWKALEPIVKQAIELMRDFHGLEVSRSDLTQEAEWEMQRAEFCQLDGRLPFQKCLIVCRDGVLNPDKMIQIADQFNGDEDTLFELVTRIVGIARPHCEGRCEVRESPIDRSMSFVFKLINPLKDLVSMNELGQHLLLEHAKKPQQKVWQQLDEIVEVAAESLLKHRAKIVYANEEDLIDTSFLFVTTIPLKQRIVVRDGGVIVRSGQKTPIVGLKNDNDTVLEIVKKLIKIIRSNGEPCECEMAYREPDERLIVALKLQEACDVASQVVANTLLNGGTVIWHPSLHQVELSFTRALTVFKRSLQIPVHFQKKITQVLKKYDKSCTIEHEPLPQEVDGDKKVEIHVKLIDLKTGL